MIPFKTDAEKMGYTQEQLDWAIANESIYGSYFIEKENCLFSTDSKLPGRFINPAPFSKFYLEEIDSRITRTFRAIYWLANCKSLYAENNVKT